MSIIKLLHFAKVKYCQFFGHYKKGSSVAKKEALLGEIEEGLKEVKKIRAGKIKSYTMADLFQ